MSDIKDTIFIDGTIYTVDGECSTASVMAAHNGELTYVGDDVAAAERSVSGNAERISLEGRTVVPGLIDSHLHLLTLGQGLSEIDIFLKSRKEVLRLVAEEADRVGPGNWILGRGWNHEIWTDKNWPTKEELDAVAPDNPVALNRADSHSIWVNSRVLEIVGIDERTPDPQGGEILRNPDGEARGILIDTAMYKVWSILPGPNEEQTRDAYRKAQAELFKLGITSVGDAWLMPKQYAMLKRAYAEGLLKIRVYGMLGTEALEEGRSFRPEKGLLGERLSLAAYKIVGDGSLGSRSAWLKRDYADRPGHRGNGRYSDAELLERMKTGHDLGFQVCVHSIGDAAVEQTVTVFEKLLEKYPEGDYRPRIEHFQIAGAEIVRRALALGIIPAMQTVHSASDRAMAGKRLDGVTLANAYPWREILDQGGFFANGSDAPMDLANPFQGFHAAVAVESDAVSRPVSREDALKSYTIWAAWAEFAEQRKGSLEKGKLADFTVLDRDIMTCSEDAIRDTQVTMTVVGGEIVHRA